MVEQSETTLSWLMGHSIEINCVSRNSYHKHSGCQLAKFEEKKITETAYLLWKKMILLHLFPLSHTFSTWEGETCEGCSALWKENCDTVSHVLVEQGTQHCM